RVDLLNNVNLYFINGFLNFNHFEKFINNYLILYSRDLDRLKKHVLFFKQYSIYNSKNILLLNRYSDSYGVDFIKMCYNNFSVDVNYMVKIINELLEFGIDDVINKIIKIKIDYYDSGKNYNFRDNFMEIFKYFLDLGRVDVCNWLVYILNNS